MNGSIQRARIFASENPHDGDTRFRDRVIDRVNTVDAAAIARADVIHAGIHGGVFGDCLEAFEQTIEIRIGLLQSESLNAVAV